MAIQEQYLGPVTGYYNELRETYWQSQSFIPENSHNFKRLTLWINKSGSLTTLTIELFAVDVNHKPTGSALISKAVPAAEIENASYGDEDHPTLISFDSTYSLTAETEYCFVCRANVDCYGTYLFSGNSGYEGYHFKTTNSGGYWSSVSDDIMFIEYDDEPAPDPPASITYPETNSHGEFEVSWDESEGADSYILEQSIDAGESWDEIYSGADTSYFRNVSNGSYLYRVKAHNIAGDSDYTTGEKI